MIWNRYIPVVGDDSAGREITNLLKRALLRCDRFVFIDHQRRKAR